MTCLKWWRIHLIICFAYIYEYLQIHAYNKAKLIYNPVVAWISLFITALFVVDFSDISAICETNEDARIYIEYPR